MEKDNKENIKENKFSKLKTTLRILNIAFCLCFVFLALFYVNLGRIVSPFLNPEILIKNVKESTGLILNLDKPSITATYDLCLNIKSDLFEFKTPNNDSKLLLIKDADVKIKIFPLIFKKIEFKKLEASDLEVNIERYKDGKFNFQKYFKNDSKMPFEFAAKSALVLIDKYNIIFRDEKHSTAAEITGMELVSTEFNLNSYADIKTKGTFTVENKAIKQVSPYALDVKLKFPINKNLDFKDYRLEMSVSNLDFSMLHPYLLEFVSKDIKQFRGKGSLIILPRESAGIAKNPLNLNLDIEDLFIEIFKNNHNNFINIKGKSKLSLTASFKKDEVFIDELNFTKPNINIKAFGTLKNVSNLNKINPDITFVIKDSSLNELLKAAPDYLIKMQQDYIPNLKKYNANAVANAEFKVKDRFRYPNMYGFVKLDDIYLLERPKNAKTSSAYIKFDGSDVDIKVDANCPNNQKIFVSGQTEIKELPLAKFDIQSTPLIDIEFAHKLLIPIHKIFGFQLGPLPMMVVKGNGQISLKTEGTRESAKLNGFFKTQNGTAVLNGLNTTLYNGNLNLLFKGKEIIYNNTTGLVEGAKIRIDGKSDVNGNLDLYVKIFDVNADKAFDVVKTSPLVLNLLGGGSFLDAYTNPKGNIDFNMRLWGKASNMGDVEDLTKIEPTDDINAKGTILFKNNSLDIFPEIKASKINGTLDFEDFVTLNLNADIYSSPFTMQGTVTPDFKASKVRSEQPQIIDLTFKTKSAVSGDLYKFFYDNQDGFQSKNRISPELYEFLNKIKFKFAANIRAKGKVDPKDAIIDMKKFTLEGWAVGLNYKGSDVLFNGGDIKFKDQKILFKNLDTSLWNANVITNGDIDKIFDEIFVPNLNFKLVSFPFSKITGITNVIDDKNLKKVLGDFDEFKGTLNGEFFYNTSGFSGSTNFVNVSFYDKKRDLPVNINSGDLKFSDNNVKINALNMSYGHTPVLIDAILDDVNTKNPGFNVFVSTNLNEESLDKLVNPMLQFPLKTKGEFTLKGRLRGTLDTYTIFANAILNPGVDLYYMGSDIGDVSDKREIISRLDIKNNEIKVRNIQYQKYILSQNKKETPYEMLKVSGGIKGGDKGLYLDNLKIVTPNPAPARLLNIFFKKSILKHGTFVSNMLLNGTIAEPKVNGNLKFSNIDVPLYDSQIKGIDLTFDNRLIHAVFEGTGMGSDVKLAAEIINKATLPVVINKAEITSKTINLNDFISGLSRFSKANKSTDPTAKQEMLLSPVDFEIKSGKFSAKEIYYNNVKAQNFQGNFKHTKDGVFAFNDVMFDIAGGKIRTNGSYEFDTTQFTINSEIENCDANTLVTDILGTKNQIFGKTNGKINLTGRQLNTSNGINTVKASVDFAIYDGKMPKLGSLEYLLRAGNLLKSGILGFTLNNVIEVLIPYKTGEFKKISGDFIVENGKIDKLNIYSKGDNLSIYTSGNYDIATNVGDFEVLGKLSTKISNLLGPIGNASFNSLVNLFANNKFDKNANDIVKNADKIPDISGTSNDFRLFAVKILGDLNADNFVKSFNWLN